MANRFSQSPWLIGLKFGKFGQMYYLNDSFSLHLQITGDA
jgi:hypothetical protein